MLSESRENRMKFHQPDCNIVHGLTESKQS